MREIDGSITALWSHHENREAIEDAVIFSHEETHSLCGHQPRRDEATEIQARGGQICHRGSSDHGYNISILALSAY
jgi:hypothetical protein